MLLRMEPLRVAWPALLFAASIAAADKIDDWVKLQMSAKHIPGMVVGVYRHGKPNKVAAYGFADLENNVKVRKDSIFEICSITKQFTAAAILLLAEDGKLKLDDPVSRYIAEWPKSWASVTLRQLLNHTSGLNDDRYDFAAPTIKDSVKAMESNLIVPPGQVWEYCNFGYMAAGRVIENASGKPYYTFLQERIFGPLGMADTHPNDTVAVTPRRVRGYGWEGKGYVNRPWLTAEQGLGDGGLISTVDDLNKWSEALKHGRILKPGSRAEMLEPGKLVSGDVAWPEGMGYGYGLGVFLAGTPDHRVEKHSGGWADASAQLTRYLDDDLTVIVLTNYGGWAERPWVGQSIARLVNPKLALPSYEAKADPDPAKVEVLRKFIVELGARRIPKDLVSERFAWQLSQNIDGAASSLKELDPSGLRFVEKIPQAAGAIYLYRLEKPEPTLFYLRFDGSGKLAAMDSFPVPR